MDKIKKVILGSDHAGFALKKKVRNGLKLFVQPLTIVDVGVKNELSVDYPDIVKKAVIEYHIQPQHTIGVLFCGTGIGMCIAANKFKNIYCALVHSNFTAKMAREHNRANFIAMGARLEKYDEKVMEIIAIFLQSTSKQGRHLRRVKKIKAIEGMN